VPDYSAWFGFKYDFRLFPKTAAVRSYELCTTATRAGAGPSPFAGPLSDIDRKLFLMLTPDPAPLAHFRH